MSKKLLLVVPLVLLLGLILFGVGVLGGMLLGGCMSETLMPEPAAEKNPPEEKDPTYGLPLEITLEDVPEVPKEILGPSPPIEDQQE
jgi:hypothetical protein